MASDEVRPGRSRHRAARSHQRMRAEVEGLVTARVSVAMLDAPHHAETPAGGAGLKGVIQFRQSISRFVPPSCEKPLQAIKAAGMVQLLSKRYATLCMLRLHFGVKRSLLVDRVQERRNSLPGTVRACSSGGDEPLNTGILLAEQLASLGANRSRSEAYLSSVKILSG